MRLLHPECDSRAVGGCVIEEWAYHVWLVTDSTPQYAWVKLQHRHLEQQTTATYSQPAAPARGAGETGIPRLTHNCSAITHGHQPRLHSRYGVMYLEGSRGVEGGGPAEPARGAGEVGVPRLVDQAGWSCPGLGLPEVVEAVGSLCIQPHAEVVEEEPLHLWSTCRPVGACQADTVTINQLINFVSLGPTFA